jgi:hypothetical protein
MEIAMGRALEISTRTSVGSTGEFAGIEWQVLSVQDSRILVIAKEIIKKMSFNSRRNSNNWADSEIREWLNGEFLKQFDEEQLERISDTFNEDVGTTDKIFLLSIDEAILYFNDDDSRVAGYQGMIGWWWLRSPGAAYSYVVAAVNGGGVIRADEINGGDAAGDNLGVRPVLWLLT